MSGQPDEGADAGPGAGPGAGPTWGAADGAGPLMSTAAADTTAAAIAAGQAGVRSNVAPVIFTQVAQLLPTVCPEGAPLTGPSGQVASTSGSVRSPCRASASPPSTTTPPMAWMGVMASPSSNQAASTANITSVRPTSDANRGCSRTTPMMPTV